MLLILVGVVEARDQCDPQDGVGTHCWAEIADVHPTQFAVGYREVQRKIEKLSEYDDADLREYLKSHAAPAVFGPKGEIFLVDHHHLAFALLKIDESEIRIEILAKWMDLNDSEFWARMKRKRWTYLYDENGQGPLSPSKLPLRINRLTDDPYRSLAGAVREAGGFEKSEVPFAEFVWAQFFRSRIDLGQTEREYRAAIRQATSLAQSRAARGLPGYIGD